MCSVSHEVRQDPVQVWLVSVILIPVSPRETLEAFDRYLTGRGLRLDAIVIGGAALNLLGVVSRATKDCDIIDPAHARATLVDLGRRLGHGV